MKGRLFLKILFGFWLTFFCLIPAIWLPIAMRDHGGQAPTVRIAAIANVLFPDVDTPAARTLAQVMAKFLLSSWQASPVGIVAGIGFSIFLAWYLAKPIRALHQGFGRLAAGDLSVRLSPVMGHRRDEMADLARDFDSMAERMQDVIAAPDTLLHDVSHELRSPLSRLQLAAALLRKQSGPSLLLDRMEAECIRWTCW